MKLREVIFSDQRRLRIMRHLSFWLAYSFYFYLQSIPPKTFDEFFTARPYFTALINTACFSPFYIAVTYFFIYYVYPLTIKKEKYLLFVVAFTLSYAIGVFINYFMASLFLRITLYQPDIYYNSLSLSYCNTRWGMIIAIVGTGIKLTKDWYLQQKENTKMLMRKNRAEIQLRKSRIQPKLLLRTLDNIQNSVSNNFTHSGDMVLKLSDILSYSLYESDEEWVPVEIEIEGVKNLVALEQLANIRGRNINITVPDDISTLCIVPMTLVKPLEACITLLQQGEDTPGKLTVHIEIKEKYLYMNILAGSQEQKIFTGKNWQTVIESLQKQLQEHYEPGTYDTLFIQQQDEVKLQLEIMLPQDKDRSKKNTQRTYEHA